MSRTRASQCGSDRERFAFMRLVMALCAFFALMVSVNGCGDSARNLEASESSLFPEISRMALVMPARHQWILGGVTPDLYFIDRYEVTDDEYYAFIKQGEYRPDSTAGFLSHWIPAEGERFGRPKTGEGDFPVRNLNLADSEAYARYYGKALPSQDEWLDAAIGRERRWRYPWGSKFGNFFCNYFDNGIKAPCRVGTFENGRSRVTGCYDMVGNVAEWTRTAVPDRFTPSHYVQGGCFIDGRTLDSAPQVFDLTRDDAMDGNVHETEFGSYYGAEVNMRHHALGFRCVRHNAFTFIRDVIPARFASFSKEDRMRGVSELAPAMEDISTVLRFLQFEHRVRRTVGPGVAISEAELLPLGDAPPPPRLLATLRNGTLISMDLEGETQWTLEDPGESPGYNCFTPARMEDLRKPGSTPYIVRTSLFKADEETLSHEAAFYRARDGKRLWTAQGPGPVRHVQLLPAGHVPGSESYLPERALILWRTSIESRPEEGNEPQCSLSLHRCEGNGDPLWVMNFREDASGFNGLIKRPPVIWDQGRRAAFILDEYDVYPTVTRPPKFLVADLVEGQILVRLEDLELGKDELNVKEVLAAGRDETDGVLVMGGYQNLFHLELVQSETRVRGPLEASELLMNTGEVIHLSKEGPRVLSPKVRAELLPWSDESNLGSEPPLFKSLYRVGNEGAWLVTEIDAQRRSVIFTGFHRDRFERAYVLEGEISHLACLKGGKGNLDALFVLVWTSEISSLVCFDGKAGRHCWTRLEGSPPAVAARIVTPVSWHPEGASVFLVASASGMIQVLEADTGRELLHLEHPGAEYYALLPMFTSIHPGSDQGAAGGILAGVTGQGLFLLDGDSTPTNEPEQRIMLTLEAFEAWRKNRMTP